VAAFLLIEGEILIGHADPGLVFPLSSENWIRLRNFSRLLVNGHLNEKNIIDTYLIAQDLFDPIDDRFPAHPFWILSSFCQYSDQMGSVLFVPPVEFISSHILSSIQERPGLNVQKGKD
jgi:hypothetical protein